jgi:PEP-CTERM motif.
MFRLAAGTAAAAVLGLACAPAAAVPVEATFLAEPPIGALGANPGTWRFEVAYDSATPADFSNPDFPRLGAAQWLDLGSARVFFDDGSGEQAFVVPEVSLVLQRTDPGGDRFVGRTYGVTFGFVFDPPPFNDTGSRFVDDQEDGVEFTSGDGSPSGLDVNAVRLSWVAEIDAPFFDVVTELPEDLSPLNDAAATSFSLDFSVPFSARTFDGTALEVTSRAAGAGAEAPGAEVPVPAGLGLLALGLGGLAAAARRR